MLYSGYSTAIAHSPASIPVLGSDKRIKDRRGWIMDNLLYFQHHRKGAQDTQFKSFNWSKNPYIVDERYP